MFSIDVHSKDKPALFSVLPRKSTCAVQVKEDVAGNSMSFAFMKMILSVLLLIPHICERVPHICYLPSTFPHKNPKLSPKQRRARGWPALCCLCLNGFDSCSWVPIALPVPPPRATPLSPDVGSIPAFPLSSHLGSRFHQGPL